MRTMQHAWGGFRRGLVVDTTVFTILAVPLFVLWARELGGHCFGFAAQGPSCNVVEQAFNTAYLVLDIASVGAFLVLPAALALPLLGLMNSIIESRTKRAENDPRSQTKDIAAANAEQPSRTLDVLTTVVAGLALLILAEILYTSLAGHTMESDRVEHVASYALVGLVAANLYLIGHKVFARLGGVGKKSAAS